jgi:hypothetical protein
MNVMCRAHGMGLLQPDGCHMRVGATQLLSFPGRSPAAADVAAGVTGQGDLRTRQRLVREAIDSLRARCRAAEEAATAAALAESRARAELERTRQHCQQLLEAAALELLELKRELQPRDRLAMAPRSDSLQSSTGPQPVIDDDAEIPFDRIDAALAASPL